MEERIKDLIKNWQRRNIAGLYCENKLEAQKIIQDIIPPEASVGVSGSVTLEQVGIARILEARGNKVFNPYKSEVSREESLGIRRQGSQADYYLASANAVSQNGELVFFSAFGNRIAGISYAKNVILVCGINKISGDIDEAIKRAREYATPLNCTRLNWTEAPCFKDGVCRKEICFFPENKRMCCQILIIEAEATPDRLKVILVGEKLGF